MEGQGNNEESILQKQMHDNIERMNNPVEGHNTLDMMNNLLIEQLQNLPDIPGKQELAEVDMSNVDDVKEKLMPALGKLLQSMTSEIVKEYDPNGDKPECQIQ